MSYLVSGANWNGLHAYTPDFPMDDLNKAVPIYEEWEGWQSLLTGITEEGELPQETRTYLERIERSVEVPVAIASVGGDRSETIYRHGFRGI
jgi:adenylosuccinate synthase